MTFSRSIDLSALPAPKLVEEIDVEAINAAIVADYKARYPQFSAQLESEPVIKLIEAFAVREMLLRIRVNDAARAVLAPLATGSDLDAVAARQGVVRRVVKTATATAPAVMESDESLLLQYLRSFETAAAGSEGAYKFTVSEAWAGVHDIAVNGPDINGYPGKVDVVITGPQGVPPTEEEIAAVRAAINDPERYPETADVTVQAAAVAEYAPAFTIFIPAGPDGVIVKNDALRRLRAACDARTFIGGEVPPGYCIGAVYGQNVVRVRDDNPVVIASDPYTVPVATEITINFEVIQ